MWNRLPPKTISLRWEFATGILSLVAGIPIGIWLNRAVYQHWSKIAAILIAQYGSLETVCAALPDASGTGAIKFWFVYFCICTPLALFVPSSIAQKMKALAALHAGWFGWFCAMICAVAGMPMPFWMQCSSVCAATCAVWFVFDFARCHRGET